MAAFDTTRTAYGASSTVGVFSGLFTRIAASITAWNDARMTRNSLSKLTDRELEDIGLVRGDIDDVASEAFFR